MAAPTSMEYKLISEFRNRFRNGELTQPYQSEDMYLLRWIRAREHNLDKAEDMLRKSLRRRKDNDLDNIHVWKPPAEFANLISLDLLGYDNENCPVFRMEFGKTKFQTIARNGQHDLYAKYIDLVYEKLQMRMKGKKLPDGKTPVSQFVTIVNMDGFQYSSLASKSVRELFTQLCSNFEANQPETVKKMYVVNSGIFFPTFFAIAKIFLAPATKNKIEILGDQSKWQPVLLQNIPTCALPPEYGGTNAAVGIVGEDNNKLATSHSEAEFLDVIIPAGEKFVLCFEVLKKKSTIYWVFRTNKRGIMFSLGCEGKIYAGGENVIVDSHLKLKEGSLACEALGEYVATFDNRKNGVEVVLKYNIWVESN